MSFDHTAVFESEVEPLLEQLFELCQKHGIPLFCNCVVSDDSSVLASRSTLVRGKEGTPIMFAAFMSILERPELMEPLFATMQFINSMEGENRATRH